MNVDEYIRRGISSYGPHPSFPEAVDTPYLLTLKVEDLFVHIKRVTFGEKDEFRCYVVETSRCKDSFMKMREYLGLVCEGLGLRMCQELSSYPTAKVIIDTTYDTDLNHIIIEEKITEEEDKLLREEESRIEREMNESYDYKKRSYRKSGPRKPKLSEDVREEYLRRELFERGEMFVELMSGIDI